MKLEIFNVYYFAVDSVEIDKTREIPAEVLHKLGKTGVFGLQIPKEFGKFSAGIYNSLSLSLFKQ